MEWNAEAELLNERARQGLSPGENRKLNRRHGYSSVHSRENRWWER